MNIRRILFLLFPLALAGAMLLIWLLGSGAIQNGVAAPAGGPHHVATNCTGVPTPCYTTIQEAVDAADPGDLIQIATGVYTDVQERPVPKGYEAPVGFKKVSQVVYISKTVTIEGGYTTNFSEPPNPLANPTTLDAQGLGRVLFIAGEITPTVEGLRLTGGDATGLYGEGGQHDAGGGVYILIATAAISNNWVIGNSAYSGGGLYLLNSSATLVNNRVISNTALTGGGGGLKLLYSNATLTGNTVLSNTAVAAGGCFVNFSDATLSDNTFTSNHATGGVAGGLLVQASDATISGNLVTHNTATGGGGGLYVYASPATLTGNTVLSNNADFGGGMALWSSDAAFNENVIAHNTADSGSGLNLRDSNAVLTNTVIVENYADMLSVGLYVTGKSSPRLIHTTIARNRSTAQSSNDGYGVYVTYLFSSYSTIAMTNTILSGHAQGIRVTMGSTATLESTLWHDNDFDWSGNGAVITGTHNFWGDPLFAADGYHLMAGSAAVDKGIDAGVTADIDGETRPFGSGYDIGADELLAGEYKYIFLPLVIR